MNSYVTWATNIIRRLQPGQCLTFDNNNLMFPPDGTRDGRSDFRGYTTLTGLKMADMMLDNIIGSAFEYGYYESLERPHTVFYRLPKPLPSDSTSRTYVSPDRRHLYRYNLASKLYELI